MFCGFGAHLEKRSRFAFLYELHPKAYEVFKRVKAVLAAEERKRLNPTFPGFDTELLNREEQ